MTIKEALKKNECEINYRQSILVGFKMNDGRKSETELDVSSAEELESVFESLCKEFDTEKDSVLYVEPEGKEN